MAVILVVEDETLIRLDAIDMIEALGYEVVEAESARDAITILESRNDIELVFSDVQMPGRMDGIRLLTVIRDRWPPVWLVLTSGQSLAQDTRLPEGAVFVPKPYSRKALANAFESTQAPH